MPEHDVAIVGGGIVGLATAYRLSERFPDRTVVVLEKEAAVATHQTGHNSGVIHSGIYYKPGSSKAINCRRGKKMLEAFCEAEGVPYEVCGKVIVATNDRELPALENIHKRGLANGVSCELIGPERLAELEPHASGVRAIHVHESGIVDYGWMCRRLAQLVTERGGRVVTGAKVTSVGVSGDEVNLLTAAAGEFSARCVVNCAGLQSDRVTKLTGHKPPAKIVPFRGEYYTLTETGSKLCRNLIYPVPDPRFPFLGVHFTRMIEGGVECGPNAVLALAREGYKKTSINLGDALETLTYPGFWALSVRHAGQGLGEMWRSFSKKAFVKALQRLIPDVRPEHLVAAPAGVRAQALGAGGKMVDDFAIEESERFINVCNAPSPAATASLSIGDRIVDRLAERFDRAAAFA